MKHQHPRGLPSRIVRETGLHRSTVSFILNGRHRPTLEQAAVLEAAFIRIGLPITRWQLLYEYKPGVPLNTWFPGGQPRKPQARPVEKRPRKKGGTRHE
jgi:transcriptional regulator with XRE-family HTH domain